MTNLLIKLFIKNSSDTSNPEVRTKYGNLSGFTGIILNIILFLGKLFCGIVSSSIAIVADGFNNLSDAGSSIITTVGLNMSSKPADNEHPFGHGRIEYISAFIISIIVIVMGIELGKTSFDKIISSEKSSFSYITAIILIVSILVKLWMFFFNRKLGKKINSQAMMATATDSISDVMATTAVLAGSVFAYLTDVTIDGYLGMAVSVFILISGGLSAKDTINTLVGEAPDTDFVNELTSTVLAHSEIIGVHDVIVHNYGVGKCVVSLHAEVNAEDDILKIHDLIDNIEVELNQKFKCLSVIHMDPITLNDERILKLSDQIARILAGIDKELGFHDLRMVYGETHTNVLFDVSIPFNFRLGDDEVCELIKTEIKKLDPKYIPKIHIDKRCT